MLHFIKSYHHSGDRSWSEAASFFYDKITFPENHTLNHRFGLKRMPACIQWNTTWKMSTNSFQALQQDLGKHLSVLACFNTQHFLIALTAQWKKEAGWKDWALRLPRLHLPLFCVHFEQGKKSQVASLPCDLCCSNDNHSHCNSCLHQQPPPSPREREPIAHPDVPPPATALEWSVASMVLPGRTMKYRACDQVFSLRGWRRKSCSSATAWKITRLAACQKLWMLCSSWACTPFPPN